MLILKYLLRLFKVLSKDATPQQIAGGFVFGAIIGLLPKFNLTTFVVFAILLLIKVNISMAILGLGIFSLIGFITDLFTEPLGYFILTLSALEWFWTILYNLPLVSWTAFNNTMVMGNLIFSLAMAYPLYSGTCKFVLFYREKLAARVAKWKIIRLLQASRIYQIYSSLSS